MNAVNPIREARTYGDEVHIDLWYPRMDDQPTYVCVGLMDVRAADDIRISYDFDRDGWRIEQASTFKWPADDDVCDPDWQEVAFVQAWGRQGEEDDT
jgi:hypothetical protein